MIERSLAVISNKNRRGSLALRNDLRNSIRVERILEKNSLAIKSKLVEERGRTLKALALRSREQEKDRTGGVGGALGILGGGALARRFFGRGGRGGLLRGLPKVPKTPSSLLRMQRGTSSLSRIGRVGRFAKPLAIVGTGLDFIGRRAEGQTNLQAGLGAGGGLAGALGGAKIGAALGTAILPGVGTVIGGIGGSILGGLAGGKLADLFTGADRRRQFEEQRVLISTQKSLFSNALDDLERVLNKLEDTSLFLRVRKDDDRGLFKRDRFDFALPELPTSKPWYDTTAAKIIGYGLLLAGALVLGGPSGEESIPAAGLMNALRQTRLGSVLIKKIPALTKLWKKVSRGQTFADELVPGVDIPGISAKGLKIRAEALLRRINPNIKFDNVPKTKPKFRRIETNVKDSDIQNLIKKGQLKELQDFIKKGNLKIDGKKVFGKKTRVNIKETIDKLKETKNTSENIDEFNLFDNEIFKNLKNFKKSDATLEPNNNDFIALAPEGVENNIFLMNSGTNNSQPIVNVDGNKAVMSTGGINTVDLLYLNAAVQQSMTV